MRDRFVSLFRLISEVLHLRQVAHVTGIMLAGAVVMYTSNTMPYTDYITPSSRHLQPFYFCLYACLTFAMWAWTWTADRLLDRWALPLRWQIVFAVVSMPAASGAALFLVLLPAFHAITGVEWSSPTPMWAMTGVFSATLYVSMLLKRNDEAQQQHTLNMQNDNAALSTALDRARLSVLEAQIEPHFLFNTLAHVKHQYSVDAVAGDRMLGMLTEYLDRALPGLESEDWTVDDEMNLIEVYLNIMTQRFGDQLRFSLSAMEESRAVRIPALTVITLVENAVRHGLAPKQESGYITIDAHLHEQTLHVDVCDDGVGLRKSSGSGIGLETVRARVKHAFGAGAAVIVEPRMPDGVRAALQLPLVHLAGACTEAGR